MPKFCMIIEDVFQVTGRGTVVTGRVSYDKIRIGDVVCLLNSANEIICENIVINGLDIGFSRIRPIEAEEGMNVALIIGDIGVDIQQGYTLQMF